MICKLTIGSSTCSVTVEENEGVVNYALSKRPNVKLVETDLPFGKEGFTSYSGKHFDPSLNLTRRYYPHTYNVDGFFVAKFQKVGPSPTGGAAREKVPMEKPEEHEVYDKTPIAADEEMGDAKDDDFGDFDENEDEEYIERAKRNAMRRRGLDPKALDKGKAEKNAEKTAEKKAEKEEAEKSPKPAKVAKAAKASKADKPEKVAKEVKADKAEKAEKPVKVAKADKVEVSKKEKKKSKKA